MSAFRASKASALLLTLGLGLTLALTACQKQAAPQAASAAAVPVKVVVSRAVTVPVVNEFVGRVAAYRSVELRARVEGILEQRHFVEGAEVKKGQLLYTIDATPYRIALNDAQADLARAKANLASAKSRETRLAPLVKENAISQQDYDDALTAVKQNEALLAVSQAKVERTQTDLGYTRVLATESGKIGATLVPEGRLVGKGEATHLATIDRLDQVYVNFSVADRDALILRRELSSGAVKAGAGSSQARIFLPDGSEFERSGKLDFSESQVNPSTGTIALRVIMPNPGQKLLPGMYVRVVYTAGSRPNTVLIPQKAVSKTPTGHVAWVVNAEHKVERRDLVVGEWFKNDWIIERGLGEGETVVVEGLQRLQQGTVVAPSPWQSEPAGPGAASAPPTPAASR
ncbi:efflux RND transporter periplasmic adaptor subunit [Paucibacter sp. KBW04]|uniref:efflux RND transporter periplasmic adaptor subunit n=1 Tax=Paucibacter sp. KBW04 TaxID=2153361 RepID=UPI0018CC4415|nr:efflux RND transporter periplasmic adaptor subunit [Paucibacter sp. KBW04]